MRITIRSCSLLLTLSLAFGATKVSGQASGFARKEARVENLKVLLLSTMLAEDGIGEWGFSALVEADGHRILFDAGRYPETVLKNAQTLKVDLSDVNVVVLSHHHQDHTGGLMTLRR